MPTALVTGGAGFIGSHIVKALVARGDTVRVVDDFSEGHIANLETVQDRIEILRGSITDFPLMLRATSGVDSVFHHAAIASVPLSIEQPLKTNDTNVSGTLAVLQAARTQGVRRVVLASSSSVYGSQRTLAKRESDTLDPLSPYAASKLAGEHYCHSFNHAIGLETVCLRYFNVFGPNQDPQSPYSAVIPRFITALLEGRSPIIYGDGQQTRDFVYVEDVVQANLLAASVPQAVGRVFNVGRGQATSVKRLLDLIKDRIPSESETVFEPGRVGDVRDSLADITCARDCLGFEPRFPLDDGLTKTVEYYAMRTYRRRTK